MRARSNVCRACRSCRGTRGHGRLRRVIARDTQLAFTEGKANDSARGLRRRVGCRRGRLRGQRRARAGGSWRAAGAHVGRLPSVISGRARKSSVRPYAPAVVHVRRDGERAAGELRCAGPAQRLLRRRASPPRQSGVRLRRGPLLTTRVPNRPGRAARSRGMIRSREPAARARPKRQRRAPVEARRRIETLRCKDPRAQNARGPYGAADRFGRIRVWRRRPRHGVKNMRPVWRRS
jgi:hypothetical protein